MSARAGPAPKPFADDPFYQYLTREVRRAARARRKGGINARRRERWATEADYRDRERARRYGLSLADYRAILARQGNACAICRRSDRRLCIDHCHATGKVRGLLCKRCNTGLGCYRDDPTLTRAATEYLAAAQAQGAASRDGLPLSPCDGLPPSPRDVGGNLGAGDEGPV
ncbi:MAG TPA: endonuclease VII domain-containing protein [Xanthobacteraceae bacterium]